MQDEIMIYLYVMFAVVLVALIANSMYKRVVLYDTQEEHIIRGKRRNKAYDVVSFGSSYARYAFDFSQTTLTGYNFGLMPQFLFYSNKMIRDYRNTYKDNALILIVLPNLVFGDPGKGKYDSERYAKLLSKKALDDEYSIKGLVWVRYFPLLKPSLSNFKKCIKTALHYKRISIEYNKDYNELNELEVEYQAKKRCDSWIKEFRLVDTQSDRIPKELEENFTKSRQILTNIIGYCLEENLRPVLVVTPVSSQMGNLLSDRFMKKVLYDNISMANTAKVPVLNYMKDKRFTHYSNYANNSDFLNAKARRNFSQIVIDDALKAYDKR